MCICLKFCRSPGYDTGSELIPKQPKLTREAVAFKRKASVICRRPGLRDDNYSYRPASLDGDRRCDLIPKQP